MPLRVAEKDGYVYAVNSCGDCVFGKFGIAERLKPRLYCDHEQGKIEEKVIDNCIPVWCPLPTPTWSFMGVDKGVEEGDRTVITGGKHPGKMRDLGGNYDSR